MNMLERCAGLLSAAQADPTRRRIHYVDAHVDLRRIVVNTAKRRISNPCLAEDAMQLVSLRIWRRITEKPGPVSPVELRMLIDGTISNAIRDDTRARRRNGDPGLATWGSARGAHHASGDALAAFDGARTDAWDRDQADADPTFDRVALLERMRLHVGIEAAA